VNNKDVIAQRDGEVEELVKEIRCGRDEVDEVK